MHEDLLPTLQRDVNRMDRWAALDHVKQVVGQVCRKDAFTQSCICAKCNLIRKDDFMWYIGSEITHKWLGSPHSSPVSSL